MNNDVRLLFEAYSTVREQTGAPDLVGLVQKLKAKPGDADKLITGIQSAIDSITLTANEKKVLLDGIKNMLGFKSITGAALGTVGGTTTSTLPTAPGVSSTGSYSTPITPVK